MPQGPRLLSTFVIFLLVCGAVAQQSGSADPPAPATKAAPAPQQSLADVARKLRKDKPAEVRMTDADTKELFRSVDKVLEFASEDTGFSRRTAVKKQIVGQADIEKFTKDRLAREDFSRRFARSELTMDCGQVVNPGILEQQIQGGVIYGLANALRAKITIEKGRIVQGNFDDYAPLRMNEVPPVEAYYVESTEAPSGAGEPPIPPLAPAICNAMYAATKRRVRALPILG